MDAADVAQAGDYLTLYRRTGLDWTNRFFTKAADETRLPTDGAIPAELGISMSISSVETVAPRSIRTTTLSGCTVTCLAITARSSFCRIASTSDWPRAARSWANRTCSRSRAIGAVHGRRNRLNMLMPLSVRTICRAGLSGRSGWSLAGLRRKADARRAGRHGPARWSRRSPSQASRRSKHAAPPGFRG
jgi:hypothetical protein